MELPLCQAAFEVLIKAITLLTRNVPTLLQRSRHPDPHLLMSQGFRNIPGGHNKAPAWPQDANLKPSERKQEGDNGLFFSGPTFSIYKRRGFLHSSNKY